MPAFIVATIQLKDPEKFQLYAQKMMETLVPFQGEPVLRGKFNSVLSGQAEHQVAGIAKFPDHDLLSAWYESEAYQKSIPLRDEAADVTIVSYSAA